MSKPQQKRTPEFKLKIAVEALKGETVITRLASEYGLHPRQITRWRDQLLSEAGDVFIHKATKRREDPDKKQLMHIIDQLSLELDFLKKKLRRDI